MTDRVSLGTLVSRGVLEIGDGYRTKRSEHGTPGYRILRVADIGEGVIGADGPDFVSAEYKDKINSKLSEPGDVLLTTKGTVGRVAIVPEGIEQLVYSPQLCYFRVVEPNELNARFLSYWFRSRDFLLQASHRANNTDMAAYINLADIRTLELRVPHMDEQRAIAEVLGALDDKIAANARLVESLDELRNARLQPMLDEAEPMPLSSTAQYVNGKAFTKNATGTGRVVVRIAELNSGLGGSTVYNDIDVDDKHVARPGDLLFAWSGSLTLHRWYRPEAIVNQHIFKVIPNDGFPMWLVSGVLQRKLAEFRAIAADKATTMGHIQRRHLDEPVLVPRRDIIEREDELMTGLWRRALAAELEIEKLAQTRDALLPLLMSGKVTVKDAEQVVEEAL
ncbi:restriction endonuclease subunit S [Janibacter anophelis]|uniref:restriction endonuclease subunit S n=1 Tax=Janibacter anophelis TaxID=319054 RepID=UPI0008321297|nr:restriction endonuclease subunit S [Janibacter anophelis]